jgi:hypothetical protein
MPLTGSLTFEVDCPVGKKVTGGGFSSTPDIQVLKSAPTIDLSGWAVIAQNVGNLNRQMTVWGICANVFGQPLCVPPLRSTDVRAPTSSHPHPRLF